MGEFVKMSLLAPKFTSNKGFLRALSVQCTTRRISRQRKRTRWRWKPQKKSDHTAYMDRQASRAKHPTLIENDAGLLFSSNDNKLDL
jgi:hypothetical protein